MRAMRGVCGSVSWPTLSIPNLLSCPGSPPSLKLRRAERNRGPGVALAETGPGHPVRCGFSAKSVASLEYWIARSSRATTVVYAEVGSREHRDHGCRITLPIA